MYTFSRATKRFNTRQRSILDENTKITKSSRSSFDKLRPQVCVCVCMCLLAYVSLFLSHTFTTCQDKANLIAQAMRYVVLTGFSRGQPINLSKMKTAVLTPLGFGKRAALIRCVACACQRSHHTPLSILPPLW